MTEVFSAEVEAATRHKYEAVVEQANDCAQQMKALLRKQTELHTLARDCLATARLFGFELEPVAVLNSLQGLTVKTAVLSLLTEAGGSGMSARDIKERLQATHGVLHDKTVGMTLFRLMRAGAVRRAGRTWYHVAGAA